MSSNTMGDVAIAERCPMETTQEEHILSEESSSDSSVDALLEESNDVDGMSRTEDLCGGFRLFKRPSSLLVNVESSLSLSAERSRQACLSWDRISNNNITDSQEPNENIRRSSNAATYNSTFCPAVLGSPSLQSSNSFSWLSSFSLADDDEESALYTAAELSLPNSGATPATDLSRPRSLWIVTTAALPWMTGTAVNPLLRAAYLYKRYCAMDDDDEIFYETASDLAEQNFFAKGDVADSTTNNDNNWSITLVIPWLEREEDRVELYGEEWATKTCVDQEVYIRQWLREKANQPAAADAIRFVWYRGRYYTPYRSIFPVEDVCDVLLRDVPPVEDMDEARKPVCIMEEPEHLLLYRAMNKNNAPPRSGEKHPLSRSFYTLSIIHTNYKSYAAQGALGFVSEMLAGFLCGIVAQAYSDKIIKLSGTLQSYASHKETICNVHGIREDFLQVPPPTGNEIYFLGKLLWAKGLDKLLLYEKLYYRRTGEYFAIDIYGNGPDMEEMQKVFGSKRGRRKRSIPANFLGRLDHASIPSQYKIFCNPSITEVLCTTSAEALAMNKFVLMPEHPSNTFFEQFPNALLYRTHEDFLSLLLYAQSHDPVPLSDDLKYRLSWEAATERLIQTAAIIPREAARQSRLAARDLKCYEFHAGICAGKLGKTISKSFFGTFEDTAAPQDRT